MHRFRIYLIAILLLAFGVGANSQEPQPEPTLIDSFGKPSCELLLSRLDFLASTASKTRDSVGFVVLYPGKNVFENAAYERAIKNNSAFRRFPNGMIRIIRATSRDELKFEMWRSSPDNPPPVRDVLFDYHLSNISRRTLLFEDFVEVFRFEGKPEYGSAGDCVNEFNMGVLSKVLLANPELSAEIIIFNKSSREARKLSRLLFHAAISENKISKDGLRINYGGSGRTKEWSSAISSIEVWLLPTNTK